MHSFDVIGHHYNICSWLNVRNIESDTPATPEQLGLRLRLT
jgi:hypothetical protein